VATIGAGVSSLCMAITLRQGGIETFTIYEKADRVGGTWRENSYPGLFVDVPSRYYQYSFAPNPDWTRLFARGPEICRYPERITDDFDLRAKIVFGAQIARTGSSDVSTSAPTRPTRPSCASTCTSCSPAASGSPLLFRSWRTGPGARRFPAKRRSPRCAR
jgi:cation diffusion facilitator CzcD-associated flavoprotein CzcO